MAHIPTGDAKHPLDLTQRRAALIVLCAGTFMVVLDASVMNTALSSIRDDLRFSQSDVSWVVNAYLIPLGGLLLFAGRLGDLLGPKRVFIGGLGLFIAASLFCGISKSQDALVVGRFLQGIGGALASGVVLGMISAMFPHPREQMSAIGLHAFVTASGAAAGLLAGAALTDLLNWHWIFFVNIPVGAATIAWGLKLLGDEKPADRRGTADILGAVLITASLMLWVYAIVRVTDNGWGSARTLGPAAFALALLIGFVGRQAQASDPLVPLSIFRARNVASINLVQGLMVAGPAGMFFFGALYMQQILHYRVLDVGLAFLPVALISGAVSLKVVPRMLRRLDAKLLIQAGLALMAGGLAWYARAPVDAGYVTDIVPAMVAVGVGAGMAFPAAAIVAMADATLSDRGLRSGLLSTAQQMGPALGLATLAAVSSARTGHSLAAGDSMATALASGYRLALLIGAGFVAAALIFSVKAIKPDVRADCQGAAIVEDAAHELDLTGPGDAGFQRSASVRRTAAIERAAIPAWLDVHGRRSS